MLGYLQFLAVTVLPPTVVVAAAGYYARDRGTVSGEVFALPTVAVVYTLPWDAHMIDRGVWWYGDGSVAAWVAGVPLGELVFILLESVLVVSLLGRLPAPAHHDASGLSRRSVVVGGLAGATVGLCGVALLDWSTTYYLGALLGWAGPVLAVQWAVGGRLPWANRRTVVLGVLGPTLFLCVVDRVALALGIWMLSARFTSGVTVAGLPIEEGAFFLLTSTFLVQGGLLYRHGRERWRRRGGTDAAIPEAR